jgi:hypothetical protein
MGFTFVVGCSALTDLGDLSSNDASTGGDASIADAASPKVIRCGTTSCDPSSLACCATCNEIDGSNACFYTYGCVDSGIQCPLSNSDLDFGCSDPASCAPGDVCCGILGSANNPYFHDSKCMTPAECDASAPSVRLCDPNATSPCPQGTTCKKDNGLIPIQGMFVCE